MIEPIATIDQKTDQQPIKYSPFEYISKYGDGFFSNLIKDVEFQSLFMQKLIELSEPKKLDKALKRNLGGQAAPLTTAASKTSTADLSTEEPIPDNDESIDE